MSKYLFLLFCILSFSVCGKEYPMLHYTVNEGLPSNNVYDVTEDRKGFLWFSTDKGIARFNGTKFETFTTRDGLPDNEIFCIEEDAYDRLWLGTYNGKMGYYENNRFYSEKDNPLLHLPFAPSMIGQINTETDSSVTFYFANLTHFINIKKNQWKVFNLKPFSRSFPGKEIKLIRKISAARYKIIYADKTILVDTNMRITAVEPTPAFTRFIKKGNKAYFINRDTLFSENRKVVGIMKQIFADETQVYTVYTDEKNFLIGTRHGLLINNDPTILSQENITRVNKDREGNYWVTTLGNGVYVISGHLQTDRFYSNVYNGTARYAKADTGQLYICTQNKSLFRLQKEKIRCLFDASRLVNNRSQTYKNAYLIKDNVYYGFGNDDNFIVSGIDQDAVHVRQFNVPNLNYASDIFYCQPYVFFGGGSEVYYTSCKKLSTERNFQMNKIDGPVPNDRIYSPALSPQKEVWFSSINKVYRVVNYQSVAQQQFGNISFRNFNFYGRYLVGYDHSNTLMIINNFTGKISVTLVKEEDCVWDKFYALDDTHILISTNNFYRLLTLYPANGKPKYSIRTIDNPFIPLRAEYICTNGIDCYFIRNGCATSIRLNDLLLRDKPPQINFTSFQTQNKSYKVDTVVHIPKQEAAYVNIGFAAPCLGKNVLYEYAISKSDEVDIWRPLQNEEISFFKLSYGEYTIKVRARTASSNYSTPAVFRLYVTKPFWAEPWVILLAINIAIALLWLVIRYRIRYLLRQKEKIHETKIKFLKAEYRSLNALMNPHFIFNALNSVQYFINSNDKKAASQYLRIFSDLVRQNMQNITKEQISLQQEITLVANYLKLEKLRFKDSLDYEIIIDDEVEMEDIMIPPLIIQPLVENAIKHGLFLKQLNNNTITIRIAEKNNQLFIHVIDNGIGIGVKEQSDPAHESYGLSSIRQRLEQLAAIHKTDIQFNIAALVNEEGITEGTEAVITINI